MNTTLYALLPALARFNAVDGAAQRLARADVLVSGALHELAVGDCFGWPGTVLPVAALTREHLKHDAAGHVWVCADLAHVEADMDSVRMLACGNLDVSCEEAEAFAASLRPLFGDSGVPLETTQPARWHLRLPAGAPLPPFDAPGQVLGDSLIHHLPEGDAGKRWRQLLNETQIVLHQHPLNRARAEQGKPTVNSFWLWGAGALPGWVKANVAQAYGDDLLLASLAAASGVRLRPLGDLDPRQRLGADTLIDLGHSGDPQACRDLLFGLLDQRKTDTLIVHFAHGERYCLRRSNRWRFWRRAR